MTWKIPLFDLDWGEEELAAVTEVVRSGWITMGDRCRRFEAQFEERLGVKHAVAVCNCTAALQLAYTVLGVGPGDEVVVPSLTFVATANAVRATGATPVFADIESTDTPLVSASTVERALSPRTRCIAVVHYAGYVCDMTGITELARQNGLHVVEDCAHAVEAMRDRRCAGAWGDVGCFSFFSNKNLSTGEGGMLTTNSDRIARDARLLRSHGMTTVTVDRFKGHAFDYDVVAAGYNFRPTEITAALGCVQFAKLQENDARRRRIARTYREQLAERLPEIAIPFGQHPGSSAHHIMPVLLPPQATRPTIVAAMKRAGVQTSIHYRAVHRMSAYAGSSHEELPLTSEFSDRELSLPLYPRMRDEDVDYVVRALADAVRR